MIVGVIESAATMGQTVRVGASDRVGQRGG